MKTNSIHVEKKFTFHRNNLPTEQQEKAIEGTLDKVMAQASP